MHDICIPAFYVTANPGTPKRPASAFLHLKKAHRKSELHYATFFFVFVISSIIFTSSTLTLCPQQTVIYTIVVIIYITIRNISVLCSFKYQYSSWTSKASLKVAVHKQIYLYDCRFRDESVSFHYFHHSLRHHSLLHACHVEAKYIIPECNAVLVPLCVSDCSQADVTKVWIHCGENSGKELCKHAENVFITVMVSLTSRHLLAKMMRQTISAVCENHTKTGFCIGWWSKVISHLPGVRALFIFTQATKMVNSAQSGPILP